MHSKWLWMRNDADEMLPGLYCFNSHSVFKGIFWHSGKILFFGFLTDRWEVWYQCHLFYMLNVKLQPADGYWLILYVINKGKIPWANFPPSQFKVCMLSEAKRVLALAPYLECTDMTTEFFLLTNCAGKQISIFSPQGVRVQLPIKDA